MNRKPLIVIVAMLVLWGLIYLFIGSDDKTIIKNKLSELETLLIVGSNENPLVQASKISAILELFEEEFEIHLKPIRSETLGNQEDLKPVLLYYRMSARGERVFFSDIDVSVSDDQAKGIFTVQDAVVQPQRQYRVHMNWSKRTGDWKINQVRLLDVES